MPKLIIIPGAASSELNWLDLITHFQDLGFSTHFLDYKPQLHTNFQECSNFLKNELELLLNTGTTVTENAELGVSEQCHDENDIILAHSMGAMLFLNIYAESSALKNSSKFLIQCPPRINPLLQSVLTQLKPLLSLSMDLHSYIEEPVKQYLKGNRIKTLEYRFTEKSKNPLEKITRLKRSLEDTLWILTAMHISCWGTPSQAFKNLVNYYNYWDEHLEKLLSKDFFMEKQENLFMTASNFDIFCDKTDSLKLAEKLNVPIKEFDWTFHNPMHFPWSQEEFIEWIKHSSSYSKPL